MNEFYLKIITMVNATKNDAAVIFFDWIDAKLVDRGWSYNELARKAGLSQSFVSMVKNGQRGLSADFCIAIAKALGERPEKVLRIAGLLPPSAGRADDLTTEEGELIALYRKVKTQTERQVVFNILRGLVQQNGE